MAALPSAAATGLGLSMWGAARSQAVAPASGAAAASSPTVGQASAAPPIFVLNSLDASISIVDPVTRLERERIPTGKEPHHLYLTPDERALIVANAAGDSLTFIDPATAQVQRTVQDILDPYHLRFSPDMKWLVIAANRLDHVDLYQWLPEAPRPLHLVTRIPAAKTPSHLAIDSLSSVAYCSLQDSDELMAVELGTHSVRWRVPVGKMPADIFLTADDRHLWVALTGDAYVEVYDVSGPMPALVTRVHTGDGAHAFRAKGDRRHVFVSNRVANTISLLDTQEMKVVDNFPGPGGPDCMELLADGRTLLVSSRWARKLSFIDTVERRVVAQVPVGRSPHGVWTLDHAPRQ